MTYKVSFSSPYNYSIKSSQPENYKTTLGFNITVEPIKLEELVDVQITGNPDKYVLMYDSNLQKWVNRNPDEVLSAATTDTTPGYEGLPNNFINELDVDLDNKIDLDAGTF